MIARDAARHGPLPDLSRVDRLTIVKAIRIAWNRVCAKLHDCREGVMEVDLNHLLKEELNALLANPIPEFRGFSTAYFDWVVTDETWESYDGATLEKQPDLLIRPRPLDAETADPRRGCFVECKLLGGSEHHTVKNYCRTGLARFISGEYAWLMPSAMMLGYLREPLSVSDHLTETLSDAQESSIDPFQTVQLPTSFDDGLPPTSEHERRFEFVGQAHGPGPISVAHLWLELTLC